MIFVEIEKVKMRSKVEALIGRNQVWFWTKNIFNIISVEEGGRVVRIDPKRYLLGLDHIKIK